MSTETTAPDFDARVSRLLQECGRQATAIYSGEGVPPAEALRLISTVSRLCEALAGVTSTDRYEDVAEALDEALEVTPPQQVAEPADEPQAALIATCTCGRRIWRLALDSAR